MAWPTSSCDSFSSSRGNAIATGTNQPEAGPSDVELLRRVGSGDAEAFREFHWRFKGFVRDVVHRTMGRGPDVDDACQNALLAIWKQAWRFDPAKSKPPTWIAIVTRSIARDALRSKFRTPRPTELQGWHAQARPASESPVEHAESIGSARDELAKLPQRQQTVIVYAYMRGLKRRQIARLEGIPVGTVKTMIRRGSNRVRRALESAA